MSDRSEVSNWKYSNFLQNKNNNFNKNDILNVLPEKEIDEAYKIISKWDNYSPTPLIYLNKLAEKLKFNKIFYKDESKRFDLKSFKALGGAYAVEKISKGNKKIIISTATAGNHGRSVAWGTKKLGLKCKIFISEFVSDARGQAMSNLGADVISVKSFFIGLMTFNIQNIPADAVLISHLIMVAFLMIIFPYSKLLHAPGLFFSPSRNQVDNAREKRHVAKWAEKLEKN